jgi:hypothetical protein
MKWDFNEFGPGAPRPACTPRAPRPAPRRRRGARLRAMLGGRICHRAVLSAVVAVFARGAVAGTVSYIGGGSGSWAVGGQLEHRSASTHW